MSTTNSPYSFRTRSNRVLGGQVEKSAQKKKQRKPSAESSSPQTPSAPAAKVIESMAAATVAPPTGSTHEFLNPGDFFPTLAASMDHLSSISEAVFNEVIETVDYTIYDVPENFDPQIGSLRHWICFYPMFFGSSLVDATYKKLIEPNADHGDWCKFAWTDSKSHLVHQVVFLEVMLRVILYLSTRSKEEVIRFSHEDGRPFSQTMLVGDLLKYLTFDFQAFYYMAQSIDLMLPGTNRRIEPEKKTQSDIDYNAAPSFHKVLQQAVIRRYELNHFPTYVPTVYSDMTEKMREGIFLYENDYKTAEKTLNIVKMMKKFFSHLFLDDQTGHHGGFYYNASNEKFTKLVSHGSIFKYRSLLDEERVYQVFFEDITNLDEAHSYFALQ